jgi:hypothetical protein
MLYLNIVFYLRYYSIEVHGMIALIEGNAKSLRLKNNMQKDFAAAVYPFETPSPPLGGH